MRRWLTAVYRLARRPIVGFARWRRENSARWTLLVVAPFVAWLAGTEYTFGRDVPLDFYIAVATLIPVLLLALVVEMAVMIPSVRSGEEFGDHKAALLAWHRRTVSAFFAFAAMGEAASLIALGANTSTTFLCAIAVFSVAFLWDLLRVAFLMRWEIGR